MNDFELQEIILQLEEMLRKDKPADELRLRIRAALISEWGQVQRSTTAMADEETSRHRCFDLD